MENYLGYLQIAFVVFVAIATVLVTFRKTRLIGILLFIGLVIGVACVGIVLYFEEEGFPPNPTQEVTSEATIEAIATDSLTSSDYIYEEKNENVTSIFSEVYLSKNWANIKENVYDNTGELYSEGIELMLYSTTGSYIEYYTENKYSTLEGKIVLSEKYKDTVSDWVVKIYADDVLIYTSGVITAGVLPNDNEFSLDISNVEKIKFTGSYVENFDGCIVYIVDCNLIS